MTSQIPTADTNSVFLTRSQLAKRYQISERTLDRLRSDSKFPIPMMVGSQPRWSLSLLEKWEAKTGGQK